MQKRPLFSLFIYTVPLMFCYLMLTGLAVFTFQHKESLKEIGQWNNYIYMNLGIFIVSLLGSLQVLRLLKKGRL